MCGIVGYLGPLNPKDVIMQGLKKLEYRGYDSAGLAVIQEGHTKLIRAMGKLQALDDKIKNESWTGHIGIGHTRWATHGVPSERNAHPHKVRGITLVHNGIIENYHEIKDALLAKGAQIASDTDSELVAHLIAAEYEKVKDLKSAVERVLPQLLGAFSIVVLCEQSPNELIAFKDGPPLVVGLGKGENFVASDVQALIKYTNEFIYLNDREIVKLEPNKVQLFSSHGVAIERKSVTLNWNAELTEKQGFAHFMLKEIHEQPRTVAAAVDSHLVETTVRLNRIGFNHPAYFENREKMDVAKDWENTQKVLKGVERVFVIACGTSFYAGNIAKYFIEKLANLPVEIDIASEFRYRDPVIPKNTLVMTISQSGETADTLAAIRLAKEKGALTLSLCNVKNSSIDRVADGHLYMNTGPEIGVASTKAFTATIALLNVFALGLGKIRKTISEKDETEFVASLRALPSKMEVVLSYDKYFQAAANTLKDFRGFLFMGRGTSYPIAMEGALKLKELAYLHAEGYAAGEMKHGPIALIDERMAVVMVAPRDHYFEKTVSNIEEVKARGGYIISLGSGDDQALKRISKQYLPIPVSDWLTNPILFVVPLQLMAYHLSSELGYDVDQPRNLAKSVTVE
ncbi:MAG: glutamine--fructose-6-phosphate transaminase (isomerizing) [Bdellovibrionaceae bacterium]|nr:glutamine--fructose-6-phosphate transaminase (isomerizing) [Pseudobdellovibrionaceae bacterium]